MPSQVLQKQEKQGRGCRRGKGLKLQPNQRGLGNPAINKLSILSGEMEGGNTALKSILKREIGNAIQRGIITQKEAKKFM